MSGKGELALCLSWDSHLLLPLDMALLVLGLRPGLKPSALGLRLNYTTGFPGSPACRQKIVGLLDLYNHMSQLSGEPWLVQSAVYS